MWWKFVLSLAAIVALAAVSAVAQISSAGASDSCNGCDATPGWAQVASPVAGIAFVVWLGTLVFVGARQAGRR